MLEGGQIFGHGRLASAGTGETPVPLIITSSMATWHQSLKKRMAVLGDG
jgi:hypothetical protein